MRAACRGLLCAPCRVAARAGLAPSHIPTDPIGGPAPPPPARVTLFFFRKILNYGKTKKSTHGARARAPATTGESPTVRAPAQLQAGYPVLAGIGWV